MARSICLTATRIATALPAAWMAVAVSSTHSAQTLTPGSAARTLRHTWVAFVVILEHQTFVTESVAQVTVQSVAAVRVLRRAVRRLGVPAKLVRFGKIAALQVLEVDFA